MVLADFLHAEAASTMFGARKRQSWLALFIQNLVQGNPLICNSPQRNARTPPAPSPTPEHELVMQFEMRITA
jgi:hypothetical protein